MNGSLLALASVAAIAGAARVRGGSVNAGRTVAFADLPYDFQVLLEQFYEQEQDSVPPAVLPVSLQPVHPLYVQVKDHPWDDRGPAHVEDMVRTMGQRVPASIRRDPAAVANRLLALVPYLDWKAGKRVRSNPRTWMAPVVTVDGDVADGRHRIFAADQLGITHLPVIEVKTRSGSAAVVGRLDPAGLRLDRYLARAARERLAGRGITVPAPTTELDVGGDARVFNTTWKHVVVRVGRGRSSEKESLLVDEDFVGGTVPVLGMVEADGHVVTWKERVDTDPEGFLARRYGGHDDDRFREIVMALVGLYGGPQRNLAILARYPETKGLARAIRRGMPTDDIDLTLNLGVTRDGRIVAYDL